MGSAVSSSPKGSSNGQKKSLHPQQQQQQQQQQQFRNQSPLPRNYLSDLIHQDTHSIRCKILNDIPLSFLHPTIILLYGPPLSNYEELGRFIAQKFQYPLLPTETYSPFHEKYHEFYHRIQEDDCRKGFLLMNLPQSISEGEKFNNLTKGYRKVVLILEQDFTKLLRSKCADWVHVPTGKRYHSMLNPPKSMKGTLDDVRNMYDDETGEALQQIVDRREYRADLKVYSKMSTGMRTFFAHSLSSLCGDQPLEDLKRETVFTLCRVIANQPKLKGRVGINFTSTQLEEMDGLILTGEEMPGHPPAAVVVAPSTGFEEQQAPQPQKLHESEFIPPLEIPPQIEIYQTFSLESMPTPHPRVSQGDILLSGLISKSPSCITEMNTPEPISTVSPVLAAPTLAPVSQFPSLTSLRFPILERVSPKSEEKSENFLSKFTALRRFSSSSSKKDSLDDKESPNLIPEEKNTESYRSYFQSKKESDERSHTLEIRQRPKTEFEDCDDDTVPGKSTRKTLNIIKSIK